MKLALVAAILVLGAHAANATQILSEEPHGGMLQPGQVVYVDNGKCKDGKVLQVTGGNSPNRSGGAVTKRLYKCVPRPAD